MLSKSSVCSKVVASDLFFKMSKDCHSTVVILRRVILDSNILAISTYVLLSIFNNSKTNLFSPAKIGKFPNTFCRSYHIQILKQLKQQLVYLKLPNPTRRPNLTKSMYYQKYYCYVTSPLPLSRSMNLWVLM